jgi:hypothetical protein
MHRSVIKWISLRNRYVHSLGAGTQLDGAIRHLPRPLLTMYYKGVATKWWSSEYFAKLFGI